LNIGSFLIIFYLIIKNKNKKKVMFCNKYSFLAKYSTADADCSTLPLGYRIVGGFGVAITFFIGILL